MPSLRVDCLKDIKGLAGYLETSLDADQKNPARVAVSRKDDYLTVTFDRTMKRNGRKYPLEINRFSDILAGYILKAYEESFLEKIIVRSCKELSKNDKDEVYRIAYSRLYNSLDNMVDTRIKMISVKIAEYLRSSDRITIEGFVTFRLEAYVNHLEIEVEKSIRQFLIEKQYDEYINLLTSYVRMQVPKVPELNVIVQKNGSSYKVEGTKPFDIPKDIIEGFGMPFANPIIDNDDFMIGFLLTCAPVRIVIHNVSSFANKELLNTIRIVFSECVLLQ